MSQSSFPPCSPCLARKEQDGLRRGWRCECPAGTGRGEQGCGAVTPLTTQQASWELRGLGQGGAELPGRVLKGRHLNPSLANLGHTLGVCASHMNGPKEPSGEQYCPAVLRWPWIHETLLWPWAAGPRVQPIVLSSERRSGPSLSLREALDTWGSRPQEWGCWSDSTAGRLGSRAPSPGRDGPTSSQHSNGVLCREQSVKPIGREGDSAQRVRAESSAGASWEELRNRPVSSSSV